MIPKIIHYCWLSGDKLPSMFKKNLDGWRKKIPDFEFILWDMKRVESENLECLEWIKEAFSVKRYAWAADVVRLNALYKYGGIYMDLDVELVKPFDNILHSDYLLGYEYGGTIEAGIMGTSPGLKWIKTCLDSYHGKHFILENGKHDVNPLPNKITKSLEDAGFVMHDRESLDIVTNNDKDLYVLPPYYLTAKKEFEIMANDKTITIHHFAASSAKKSYTIKKWIRKTFGNRIFGILIMIKKCIPKRIIKLFKL